MRFLKSQIRFGSVLILTLVLSNCPLESQADSLEDGTKLYSAKDYVRAKIALEKAAQENPNSWHAHLYLGHTLLTLGNFTHAKYQYQLCQRLTTNSAVLAQCTAGISRAEKYLESRKSGSSTSTGSSSSGSSSNKEDSEEEEPEMSPKEKRKKMIMNEAKEKMDKIRAEAKKQMEDEKNSSQELFRHKDGSVVTDISDEREKEIMKEADDRCKKIREDAEVRAR